MILPLILLFILVPIVELYVILQVGDAIGAVPTILLLAADSMIGAILLRSQGRSVWRKLNRALAERRMPHREILDGIGIVFGGALLLTPGFITDVVGLLLLLPPSRVAIRRFLTRRIGRRLSFGLVDVDGPVEGRARQRPDPPPRGTIDQ
jgi:UPF0716 protein FxsA